MRVSPAEGLDALEGLRLVGLAEREGVRDTLRTTLVKSGEDIATFERLFDLYFGLQPEPACPARVHPHVHDNGGTATELRFGEDLEGDPDDGDHDHSHAGPEPIDLRRFLDEDKLRPSHDIHGESERLRLSVFGQQLMLNRNPDALQKALRERDPPAARKARPLVQPRRGGARDGCGGAARRAPAGRLRRARGRPARAGRGRAPGAALAAQADDILRALPELLKELLERRAGWQRRHSTTRRSRAARCAPCSTSSPPTRRSSRRRCGAWDGRSTERAARRLRPTGWGGSACRTRCGAT